MGDAGIEEHAAIGDGRTVALIDRSGTVDWLPIPSLDSPPVFASLLDRDRGGRMLLHPVSPFESTRRYLPGTNVLETTFTTATGSVRVTDALSRPSARPLLWNQLIRRIDGLVGKVSLAWSVEPRFDYGRSEGRIERRQGVPLVIHGPNVLALQ